MKIVYMGTPDFAVPPLAALVKAGLKMEYPRLYPNSWKTLSIIMAMLWEKVIKSHPFLT